MDRVTIRNPVIREKAVVVSGDPVKAAEQIARLIVRWLGPDVTELFVTPISVTQIRRRAGKGSGDRKEARTRAARTQSTGRDPYRPHAPHLHIRRWAREAGYDVSDRGPLSPSIIKDYERAHPPEKDRATQPANDLAVV